MNGIINFNKPKGPTSYSIVSHIGRILNVKKIGHIGTLDPEASGLLPICIGKATKIVELISDFEKIYIGVMKLGTKTDTQDASGKILSESPDTKVSKEKLMSVLKKFKGEIYQTPPMYSAARYKGKRLYQLARKGLNVQVNPKKVKIYALNLIDEKDELVTLKIRCSKGTYIRTLFNDIGESLGCGAHMVELQRTSVGIFDISNAITISRLHELKECNKLKDVVIPIDDVLNFMPIIFIKEGEEKTLLNGMPLWKKSINDISKDFLSDDNVLIKNFKGKLLALGKTLIARKDLLGLDDKDVVLRPKKILI